MATDATYPYDSTRPQRIDNPLSQNEAAVRPPSEPGVPFSEPFSTSSATPLSHRLARATSRRNRGVSLYGYEPEKLIGKSITGLYRPEEQVFFTRQ